MVGRGAARGQGLIGGFGGLRKCWVGSKCLGEMACHPVLRTLGLSLSKARPDGGGHDSACCTVQRLQTPRRVSDASPQHNREVDDAILTLDR